MSDTFLTWGRDLALAHATSAIPSVYQQTEWPIRCQPFLLPCDPDVQYFNPTLADWNGSTYLITRRFHKPAPFGQNSITFWLLDQDLMPSRETPLVFPSPHPNDNYEDPRAFTANKTLYLSYAHWRNAPAYFVQQGLVQIERTARRMTAVNKLHPGYSGNNTKPRLRFHEKNWTWFWHDGALHFVYGFSPHTVVRYDANKPRTWTTSAFQWPYGLPRGGTPPVLVGNEYWSFFHSSIDISNIPPRRRYYMGAYAFAAQPPFAPRYFTATPLLVGSEADPRDAHAPLCVFPGGALLRSEEWLVAFGVNDCACAYLKIPHDELRARCIAP